jgi:hypothetical protein
VFSGVSLSFRGLVSGRLRYFGRFGFIVPYEMFWLIVVIIVALRFFLKAPEVFRVFRYYLVTDSAI